MESFKFVSARGNIEFSLASRYIFSSVENLNGADVRMQEDKYIGLDGAEYSDILYEPDDITIKGFIRADKKTELPFYRALLFKILNGKENGLLYYKVNNKSYFTEVLPLRPVVGESVQNILNYIVYFKRISPMWKEERQIKENIYELTKKLKTTFTLPCEFSQRANKVEILNGGDIPCGCVLTVKGMGESNATAGIKIINKTTEKEIYLDYLISEGEEVVIDTNEYTVTSSINGNIINRLVSSSEFFKLDVGVNELEVVNLDAGFEVLASVAFYNVVLGV